MLSALHRLFAKGVGRDGWVQRLWAMSFSSRVAPLRGFLFGFVGHGCCTVRMLEDVGYLVLVLRGGWEGWGLCVRYDLNGTECVGWKGIRGRARLGE